MPRHTKQAPPGEASAVRLELENEWAWCGDRRLDLAPKEFAVLRHLMDRAGRLVTKRELLDTVWGGAIVSEAALTSCIRDLRRALGDSSSAPRYVETVHRRGFRFVGPIARAAGTATGSGAERRAAETDAIRSQDERAAAPARASLVGREAELESLREAFATARTGRRQLVFVTGEAGIGKTALVESFLAELDSHGEARVGRGQCIEQFGAGEPYLPVLEALGRLARGARGEATVATLRRYAPSWLAHLPGLLGDEDLLAVQRRARATAPERGLRDLIEALEALGAEAPLVLVLEDLHWSDAATIDLLTMLARRREPARVLTLATYRPADVSAGGQPLRSVKQELEVHGQCHEVALSLLGEASVDAYLATRFPGASFPPHLARILHRNTGGNPLFLVNVVDDWIARGRLREAEGRWDLSSPVEEAVAAVPRTLWQMVEEQIERLTPQEQAVLAVASVAGGELSAALATADGIDLHDAEQWCDALARRGRLLRAAGVAEWPDGTVAGRYGFIHALYRDVLYARIPIGRRVGLHLRIGARLEQAHGERAAEIAGELAMHFEQGRDFERAVRHRRSAAEAALRRHGHREAAEHARRALELLGAVPQTPGADHQELALQMILGSALAAKGWAAPEVAGAFGRARHLCSRLGAAPECLPSLTGLWGAYLTAGQVGPARDLTAQLTAMAEATADASVELAASTAAGMTSFLAGELSTALRHLERALAIYDPDQHGPDRFPTYWGGYDPGVSSAVSLPWVLWPLGYPDRAAARMGEALARARSLEHPLSLTYACHFAAAFHQCRGDVGAVRELEELASRHSAEHGFDMFSALGTMQRGWVRAASGEGEAGVEEIHAGLGTYRSGGAGYGVPTFLALLAQAYAGVGRPGDGLTVLADARKVAERTGARYWDAELRRLEGVLILQAGRPGSRARRGAKIAEKVQREGEARLLEALEIARRQEARMLELRAAVDLAGLWQSQGRAREALDLVSPVYGWFTEGFDTLELRRAKALLEALERRPGR